MHFDGYFLFAIFCWVMQQGSTPKSFEFVGGALCVDFCNTVGGKRGVVAREKLETYSDLLSWAQQASLLTQRQAKALSQRAADCPQEAATILGRAIDLREALYRMFLAIAQSKRPANADLARLNWELARNQGRRQVIRLSGPGAFDWQWSDLGESLENLLGPVSHSAAGL